MALTSDLKHVLENVLGDHHTAENPIILATPIKFILRTTDENVEHEIRKVYLKGRSWKMVDEWNNEWTISTLDYMWQCNLYYNILSLKDSRVKPQNYNLSL